MWSVIWLERDLWKFCSLRFLGEKVLEAFSLTKLSSSCRFLGMGTVCVVFVLLACFGTFSFCKICLIANMAFMKFIMKMLQTQWALSCFIELNVEKFRSMAYSIPYIETCMNLVFSPWLWHCLMFQINCGIQALMYKFSQSLFWL